MYDVLSISATALQLLLRRCRRNAATHAVFGTQRSTGFVAACISILARVFLPCATATAASTTEPGGRAGAGTGIGGSTFASAEAAMLRGQGAVSCVLEACVAQHGLGHRRDQAQVCAIALSACVVSCRVV